MLIAAGFRSFFYSNDHSPFTSMCEKALWVFALSASYALAEPWEGYRNRLVPDPAPITRQDFGYRDGRIGGWIQRSTTPAWYAKVIQPVTLERPLTASGTFAVRGSQGGSGVLFGWFNSQSRGWRMPNSLVIRLDGNANNCWIFFEYGTHSWFTGGGATFEGRYQTTKTKPLPADGKAHPWRLQYRPPEWLPLLDATPRRWPNPTAFTIRQGAADQRV